MRHACCGCVVSRSETGVRLAIVIFNATFPSWPLNLLVDKRLICQQSSSTRAVSWSSIFTGGHPSHTICTCQSSLCHFNGTRFSGSRALNQQCCVFSVRLNKPTLPGDLLNPSCSTEALLWDFVMTSYVCIGHKTKVCLQSVRVHHSQILAAQKEYLNPTCLLKFFLLGAVGRWKGTFIITWKWKHFAHSRSS